jgi:ABC-2 type transport system ATP-binding protein
LFSSYYPNPLPLAEVIAMAGLNGLEERYSGKLSGGQKQRLLFALAVCGRPDLVFLDEPTTGLDVEARRAFWQQVRSFVATGRAVVLTTHYLEEADALADRIVVIDHGRVIARGTPAEIKATVAGRRIRCLTALDPEYLRTIPAVSAVKQNGNITEIFTSNAEQTLRRLLAEDADLADLEVTGAGLEEAFLDLTQDKQEVAV